MAPLFSCVVPVKGARPFLAEALASLSGQGLGDRLEVIVQDGDAEPDAGQSDALNKGFAKARGEWLFWLNADDVLLPGALERVLGLVRRRERKGRAGDLDWIAGNQLLIDDDGRVKMCSVGNRWHDRLYRHAVPHVYGPSSFFRRSLFERVGGFDKSLEYCMDWDLWIKFMKAGARFERIGAYLWAQRQWAGSKTQRALSKVEMSAHLAEVGEMAGRNGISLTRGGAILTRLVRLAEGCYWRELRDGARYRGMPLGECCRRHFRREVAVVLTHPAPYREPAIEKLKGDARLDVAVSSIFGEDYGHGEMGLGRETAPLARGCGTLHPGGCAAVALCWRLMWRFSFRRRHGVVIWPAYAPWWLTVPVVARCALGREFAVALDTVRDSGGLLSRLVKRLVFRQAKFLWVPGGAARRYLAGNYGIADEKIVEGLYLPDFVAEERPDDEEHPPTFLMVANSVPLRRMDAVAEGFRQYARGGGRGRLVLCGRGTMALGGGVVEAVEGVPFSGLPALYGRADVYVHNGEEQFSTALLMGAMAGKPLIAGAEVGACADLFAEGNGAAGPGMLVGDWRSADAWGRAFAAMAGRQDEWKAMGAEAKRRAGKFNAAEVARGIAERIA